MPAVLVAGETLIDFLPGSAGPLASVETFSRRPGGAPANVAVALSRLGRPPWFWTRVGAGPFGDLLVETLAEYGVPDRFVERDPDAKTTLAFVAHDDAGEPSFTFYRDGTADTRLEPGRVPDGALDAVGWVSLGSVLLADEPSRSAVLDLAERARSRGCTVVFDPNARPELWSAGEFETVVGDALEHVDVLSANAADLAALGIEGGDADALAAAVHDRGPHTLLLTRGETGAALRADGRAPWDPAAVDHPGYEVDAVDTTGAGDAFTAGAIAGFLDGDPPAEVLAFANAVAAAATTARGAMAALPDRDAVRSLR